MPALHPERHHLVWLTEAGWQRLQDACPDARQRDAMRRWQHNRWPVITRRADTVSDTDTGAGADDLCAGIALPPDSHGNKPRIAVRVRANEVAGVRAPFLLRDIVAARVPDLPPGWQDGLAQLQQHMARAGITLAVFGSLAWQALTGLPYVRASSDIDLLFTPDDPARLAQGVSLLAWQAMFLPLDGEIVFPGGAAVSWKEWRQVAVLGGDAEGKVLVKRRDAVALERVGTLDARLAAAGEAPCAA